MLINKFNCLLGLPVFCLQNVLLLPIIDYVRFHFFFDWSLIGPYLGVC